MQTSHLNTQAQLSRIQPRHTVYANLIVGALILLASVSSVWAVNGTWTNKTDSVWSATTSWLNGTFADGGDYLADFSTISGVAALNVTLDSPRTLGNFKFGGATAEYLVGASTLTLQNSTNIPVVTGTANTMVFGVPLASSQQVLFNGGITILTNELNALSGGVVVQENPFGFTSQNAIGSGTIQIGNAPGGNNAGAGQCGFTALSPAAAGTSPITLNNDLIIRTIRWIVSQASLVGLNPQPIIMNGHVTLDMGINNVRDIALGQPVTINGVLSGGQSGTSQFGLTLSTLAGGPLTLANSNNDFVGNINFGVAQTLGVNSDGALGYYQNRINFNSANATLRIDAPFTIPSYRGAGGIALNVAANATINCTNGNDLQIDAIVQGGATLTKSGTGKLTLTAANTFSGPLAFNIGTVASAGTLAITGSGSVNTAGAVTVPTNTIFLLADSAAVPNIPSVTVNNGGQFILQGSPTLKSTLIIGTAVGGTLDVSGVSGGFTLAAGQTLGGSGGVNGSVVAASSSVIVPGTVGGAGTLNFTNDLTLNGQGITFDLRNNLTEGSGTNDEIVVAGSLTLSGGEKIYLNYLDSQLAAGTYTLLRYGVSKSGSFSLGAAYPNVTLDETSSPGSVLLVVSGSGSTANNLTWKGDGTANLWDINSSANWVTNWANPVTVYTDPSKVLFDDNGSNSPAINLNAAVLPNTVTFSNTAKAYTISGSGKISGSASLVLKGTNSVTLASDNDYTGGTTFATNGILRLGNGGTTGSAGSGTIALGGTSPKVIVNRTTPLTLGAVTGTGGTPQVQQIGSGTTTLGGSTDNAYLGGVVNAGTLVLGKSSSSSVHALGTATTLNGGTLQLGGLGGDQIVNNVTVTAAGGTFDLAGLSESISALNGRGFVSDSVTGGVLTLTNAPGLNVSGGAMTVNGSITMSGAPAFRVQTNGVLNLQGGTFTCSTSSTAGTVQGGGVFNMTGGTLTSSGTYFALGSSSGTAIVNFSGGTFTQPGEFLQFYGGSSIVTVSGTATVNCHYWSYGDQKEGTNYFNGGLTKVDTFHQRGAVGWAGYFNGGTIQAKSSQARFLPEANPYFSTANQHAYISTNGLIFDTQGFNVGVSQNLEHDPSLGVSLDGGLVKLGTGTLTLTGTNTFTGSISNTAGVLAFNNAGSYNNVFIGDNATNQITVAGNATSLTNNTLTMGSSGSGTMGLTFDLSSSGTPAVPIVTVTGPVTNYGNVLVTIIAPFLQPGKIPLIKYGSMDPAGFASTWTNSSFPYVTLTLTNDTVNKLVSLIVVPGVTKKWKGNISTAWDTSTLNWTSNGVAAVYVETTPPGEPVTFDDTASSFTVDISTATVDPLFINMTNSLDYTFAGTLGFGGTGALVKNGTGTLHLNNGANTYSGITTVSGGSLAANAPDVLSPNSAMTFNSGVMNIASHNQAIGNITFNNSSLLGTGTLTGGSLTFDNGASMFTLGPTLAGALSLNMKGTGEMLITNNNTFTGATIINSGTVRVQNGNALGLGGFTGTSSTTVLPGARIILDGSISIPEQFTLNGTGPDGLGCLIVTNGNVVVNGSPCGVVGATIHVAAGCSATFQGQAGGNNTKFYMGSMTKTGPGPLILDAGGNNATAMVVAEGSMMTSNTVTSATVTVNGGATFAGSGTQQGALTIMAGGTLTPDQQGYIGTLTCSTALTNAGSIVMQVLKTEGVTNADRISVSGAFVNSGTVAVITNAASTLAFAAGDSFKLFTLTNYATLSAVVPSLPALPTGLLWTNKLGIDGTISVYASVSTAPFSIASSVSGTNLTLQWPADHIGWRLLVQTNLLANGLSTNMADWDVYPNSSNVDQVVIPLDPAKPTEFFRMVYP